MCAVFRRDVRAATSRFGTGKALEIYLFRRRAVCFMTFRLLAACPYSPCVHYATRRKGYICKPEPRTTSRPVTSLCRLASDTVWGWTLRQRVIVSLDIFTLTSKANPHRVPSPQPGLLCRDRPSKSRCGGFNDQEARWRIRRGFDVDSPYRGHGERRLKYPGRRREWM